MSQSQKKTLKQNPQSLIRPDLLEKAIIIIATEKEAFQNSRSEAIDRVLKEYRTDEMFNRNFLEMLKPEFQKSLSFLHDYKQFVARVKQNINVVLQTRFPDEPIDVQLQKASVAEAAIYWSAALMDDKLQTALLLTDPSRLTDAQVTRFRLHGFILKHLRIYRAAFDAKEINVIQSGHSIGDIVAPQAFAAIPHTLLDNALKYSSRGSQVTVGFKENDEAIEFSVTSFGPKIEEAEADKIFELFQRGAAGVAQQEEGSGIGLYLAQFIARHLGSEIKVRQSLHKGKFGHETVFWLTLNRVK